MQRWIPAEGLHRTHKSASAYMSRTNPRKEETMAKADVEYVEYQAGYSNALLVALKTYLETLNPTQKAAFDDAFQRNCNNARLARIVLYSSQPETCTEDFLKGFDLASQALLSDDDETTTGHP